MIIYNLTLITLTLCSFKGALLLICKAIKQCLFMKICYIETSLLDHSLVQFVYLHKNCTEW